MIRCILKSVWLTGPNLGTVLRLRFNLEAKRIYKLISLSLPPPALPPSAPMHHDKCKLRLTFFILASCSLSCFSRSSLRSFSCSALRFSSRTHLNLCDNKRDLRTAWSLVIPFKIYEKIVEVSHST